MKGSKGHRRRHHTHLVNTKWVERTEGKEKRKMEERHNHNNNQQKN